MTKDPVAIIGAGIAGLTAAHFLRRHQVPFVLFEANKEVAGMARSYVDQAGFSYDFGAHFITNRLARAIGVEAQCRDVAYYGESVLVRGKYYSYPFGLMKAPRYLSSALKSRLSSQPDPRSARDWFHQAYGQALADEVALPLVEAWSGAPSDQLAPAVGNKLSNGIPYTLYLKAMSRIKGVAVSCGYSHEMPESAKVWHVYPNGGVASLCHRLGETVTDAIRLESPVERIYVENGRAVAVRAAGVEQRVSAVISTAPCHVLAKMVSGTNALAPLARFRYRPMIFVNLRFLGRGLLPDTVLWTPDGGRPFFRLTETALSMPWLAPEGKTLITCDIGAEVGDHHWKMSDDELGALCVRHLDGLAPKASASYLGCRVLRTPIAYPVFLNSYEADRQALARSTGVENLLSIGRNGEFAHILMEDIYWRTQQKVRDLVSKLASGPFALAA